MAKLKIIVAPNAFKGSVSAPRAAQAIGRGLRKSGLDCDLDLMPIADGGDDTLEVLVGQNGRVEEVTVQDPLGRPIQAGLGLVEEGRTAVVEMARASGLKLLKLEERDPLKATTFGTGQLIARAVALGCQRVIIGVGGSATVDGGAGCLQALGFRLLDGQGREVGPGGGPLAQVERLEVDQALPGLDQIKIEIACDVLNPVVGPDGAAAVFGPQKGAGPAEIKILDASLDHFLGLAAAAFGRDVRHFPRAGAAGALAGGLAAFVGAELTSGIELILAHLQAEERLRGAWLAVTGEGRIDFQTLSGKGPMGLAQAAARQDVPVVALAGSLGPGLDDPGQAGLAAVLPVCPGPLPLEEAMARGEELLEAAGLRLGRLLALGRR